MKLKLTEDVVITILSMYKKTASEITIMIKNFHSKIFNFPLLSQTIAIFQTAMFL